MDKILMVMFFISWLVCEGSLEASMDDPRNMGITVLAVIVAIACAVVMGSNYGE